MTVEALVSKFVETINSGSRELLPAEQVPQALRRRLVDQGSVDWMIVPVPTNPWVKEFEVDLPAPFPPSFRTLLEKYAYPAFEFHGVQMYANTNEGRYDDFRESALADTNLMQPLLVAGFMPFARLDQANYDPLCFDTRSSARDGEWSIVRADHEEAMIHQRAVVAPFAESFGNLIVEHITSVGGAMLNRAASE